MRKNYILALLATGVLPLSAYAAIEIPGVATDKGSWDLSGVSDVTTDASGIITVPGAQGGYPACTINNLPAGNYIISGVLTNAEFKVLLDGVEIAITAGKFTTTTAGNLVIEVKAIDKAEPYSFGNVTLTLDVDLEAIQNDLNALMPTGTLTTPSQHMSEYDADGINGNDVIAEYNGLKNRTAGVTKAIADVNPAGATPAEQLAAYINYVNNDVEGLVKKYAADVNAYENGVKVDEEWVKYPISTLNTWAETLYTNKINHNSDLNKINSTNKANPGWQKKLDDLLALIESTGHTAALQTQINAANTAISSALTAISNNWNAAGVQAGKATYALVDMSGISDAYNALQNAYSTLVSDEDRYETLWLPKYQELTNAYINAQQKIKELYEGEPGQKERQDSVMEAVTAIYNDAVNSLEVKYGDGQCTDPEYTSDKGIIDAAIAALAARTEDDANCLAAEQAALTKANGIIEGLDGSLGVITINKDAYDKANLENIQKALNKRISALQDEVDRIYASTEVLTDAYVTGEMQTLSNALQADIDAFAAQVAIANQLGGLTTALNEARQKIENDVNNQYLLTLEEAYKVNVVDMMNGSYTSLQEAISQQQGIYDNDGYASVDPSKLDNIKASIDEDANSYLENGLKMAADFANAYKIALPDLAAANAFVDYIKNSNPAFDVTITSTLPTTGVSVVNGVNTTSYKTTANGYVTTAQSIVSDLQKARTYTPQNAFDAIEAVMVAIGTNDLANNIPATKLAFIDAVIASENGENSNFEELNAANADLIAQIAAVATYAGYSDITPLQDASQKALDKVLADYAATLANTALSVNAKISAIEVINNSAKEVIAKMQTVQNEIDKVVLNWEAYQYILGIIAQVEAKETGAKTFAEENSYQPAQDTWKALIDQKIEAAQDVAVDIDGVNTSLLKVYEAVKMLTSQDGKTNKDNFKEQLDEILKWFAGFENAVLNNEIAHNSLLDESAVVTALVDDVNQTIQAAEVPIILEDGQNAADVLKGYIDELSDLDTDLYNIYKEVACEGQEIAGSEEAPTLMYQYEALRAKINDLNASLSDDYAKALKEYNEQFIADNWNAYRSDLMEVYTQAIVQLDEYQSAVENCPLLDEDPTIQDGVDHQPIYTYAPQIQSLLAQVTTMLDQSWPTKVGGIANANQRKLTDADLASFIADANAIIDGIGIVYTDKVEQITNEAEVVLANTTTNVNDLISNVENELQTAGCDAPSIANVVKAAKAALTTAAKLAVVPTDGRYVPTYIINIAAAINELDNVEITPEQKTGAAVSTFNNAVAKVQQAINAATQTLNESELPAGKKNAFQNRLNYVQAVLNSYQNDEVTLENLIDELAKVNAIDVATIQNDIDTAIENNKLNKENKVYLDDKVSDLQDTLDDLTEWVEKLLVAADVPLTTLDAQVQNVDNAILNAYNNEYLSDASKVTALENQIDAVETLINNAYAAAYQSEIARLQEELNEANRAYNEAAKRYEEETGKAEYPDTDEGKAYTAKIDAQALALGTAALVTGVPTTAEQDAIVKIQTALLEIQIDLGYLSTAEILAELDEAAQNAINSINQSKDALGNYAAEKYAADYEALVAEVEALQQQWTENETTVIVQEGVYLRDINKIIADLATLDATAAAYQAEREANAANEAASNAAYVVLNNDLNIVRQAYNATNSYNQQYAEILTTDWSWYLSVINTQIQDNQDALDVAKANYTCVGFSFDTAPGCYGLSYINSEINTVNVNIWNNITTTYKGMVTQAIANASDALNNGASHEGADGFAAAINTLRFKRDKLEVVTNGSASAGEAFVNEAKAIIADAEALFQEILDAEYIAGDITGTGEVTAADYEALINLLGQIEDPTDFGNPAYDVNGDGSVTAADIAKIIDLLMGRDSNAGVMSRMPAVTTNNAIYVVKTGVNNGVTRYAVMLNNTVDLFCAQMDVILGDGMEIVNEGVAERTSNNEFYGSTTYSGKHRVILSSINKSTFVGSEGAVVYIDVLGEGELSVDNVFGVDVQGRMYNISVMSNVTGIESITNDAKNADIFNVSGQKLNRTERGVNIIRTEDGKTSKVLKK